MSGKKLALVTGAGQGIGAEIAGTLVQAGWDVALNDLTSDALVGTRDQLEKHRSGSAMLVPGDIAQPDGVAAVFAALRKFGVPLQAVINNAGITRDALLLKTTPAQWDSVIAVNLTGTFQVGQAAAQWMSEHGLGGRIVNLASIAWLGNVGQSNYAASKAGVVGLTRTWALELARYKITVNAIAPGLIETAMTGKIPQEIREKFIAQIPLRRMGTPQEIAATVRFLLSEEAAYLTGQILGVDGGLSVGF